METIYALALIQFMFWFIFSIFAGMVAEESNDFKAFERLYKVARFSTVFDVFKDSTMYTVWIYIISIALYLILLPLSLWTFLNLLPFKLVWEALTGKLVTGTLSFIFQDKRKVT